MRRVKLGPKPYLYPMPVVLVGAKVRGKPNFCTVAYCGLVNDSPPTIGVALERSHYTNEGVRANRTFSVNIPSCRQVRETDYCGTYSGKTTDKSSLFSVSYGQLGTAPLIDDCPVTLECRLHRRVAVGKGIDLLLGEIVEVYARQDCLTGGQPDLSKIDPILFTSPDNNYWRVGQLLAKAWEVGKRLPRLGPPRIRGSGERS